MMAFSILKLLLIVLVGYLSFTSGSTSVPDIKPGIIISSCANNNNINLMNISSAKKAKVNNTCPNQTQQEPKSEAVSVTRKKKSTSFFEFFTNIFSLIYNEKQEITWNNYLIGGIGVIGYILVNTIATASLIIATKMQKVHFFKEKGPIVTTDTIEKGHLEPLEEEIKLPPILDWNDLEKLELELERLELESTFN